MGSDEVYSPEYGREMSEIVRNQKKPAKIKPSKIEKVVTEDNYKKAKKVVYKYKTQLRNEIREEQKNCKHESYYRYEYSDDHYINVCRKCFHEWEEKNMPFLLEDYSALTQGAFKITEMDRENLKKYQERLKAIDQL